MKLFRWISDNLATLLTAFVLAIVIWASAVTAANPNREEEINIPLEIRGQREDILVVDPVPEFVTVTLLAPESVLEQLQRDNSLKAWISLNDLENGTYRIPVEVGIPDQIRPVRILERNPSELELRLDNLVQKALPITTNVEGTPAIGYKAGSVSWGRENVTVIGREDRVERIVRVEASLDISDADESISRQVELIPRDQNGQEVTGVDLNPESISVTQEIILQGGYRNVAVNVVTEGTVEPGYRFTSITPAPPTVMVFSEDPQLVEQLPGYVNTKPLDLTGVDDYLETLLELDLPQGVTVVGDSTILVQVNVTAIETTMAVSREIEAIGLLPGLQADIAPLQVSVRLSGPVPTLDNLTMRDIRVIVDLTNLEEGVHTVEPSVEILPQDLTLEDISPTSVEVTISQGPTPTPGS
jgi:YbbR domain-containing protein